MKILFTLIILLNVFTVNAQIIFNVGSFTFTKTSASQQDCITANVCLSRGSNGVLYNAVTQSAGAGNCSSNPANTEWAYGNISNWSTLTYQNLYNLNGCTPPSMVNQTIVLHLITDNIYLQITFSYWQSGGGGNFTYTRTTMPLLGVHLLSFNARKENNNSILLNWKTASEENSRGFYLQRSNNGDDFKDLTFISSNGNSDKEKVYNYTDNQPLDGTNYYRLRQVDYNGSQEFSGTVSQKIISNPVEIYPNPAHNCFSISGAKYAGSHVKITNALGMIVKELNAIDGKIDIALLTEGIYYVNVSNGSESFSRMIVKR